MIRWSMTAQRPVAIRYGKSSVDQSIDYPYDRFMPGKWEILEQGDTCTILAVGSMVEFACTTRDLLQKLGIHAQVVNCSSVKPLDENLLCSLRQPIITMEEHMKIGGFGSNVTAFLAENKLPVPLITFGVPDTFVQHGTRAQLLKYLGLTPKQMAARIAAELHNIAPQEETK